MKVTTSGAITPVNVPVIVASVVVSKFLFVAAALPIDNAFGVISALKPVGKFKLYFEASAPLKVCVEVTAIAVPAFAATKVPVFETVTTSAPTIPTKVEPEMVAVVVLS